MSDSEKQSTSMAKETYTQDDLQEVARTYAVEGESNLRELLNLHGANAVPGVEPTVLDKEHSFLNPEEFQIIYQARETLRTAIRRKDEISQGKKK